MPSWWYLAFQRAHTTYSSSLQHTSLVRRTAGEISITGCFETTNVQVNKTMNGKRLVDRKNSGLFDIFFFLDPQDRKTHGKV
jgi:hypothetical protein